MSDRPRRRVSLLILGRCIQRHQRVSLPWTNVLHFTGDKVSEVAAYFDSLALMVQLGHVQPPQP
jgi:hypothetical protein